MPSVRFWSGLASKITMSPSFMPAPSIEVPATRKPYTLPERAGDSVARLMYSVMFCSEFHSTPGPHEAFWLRTGTITSFTQGVFSVSVLVNISPSPVRSQWALTPHFSTIDFIIAFEISRVPFSIFAIELDDTSMKVANSCCVIPLDFLIALICSSAFIFLSS